MLLEVESGVAWERASGEGGRPLALDEQTFHALFRERLPLYEETADAHAHDADGIVLAAAGVDVRIGALELLEELVPGTGPVEVVADANVAGIHGVTAQLALGSRDVALHEVPPGEPAKAIAVLERLWRALRIGRDGTIVGLGGGCTTDLAGLRRGDLHARRAMGRGADDPRRPGGRRHRRQDGRRPAGRQEPRRLRSTGRRAS